MKQPIYMDHAAATPMAPSVTEAMLPYFTEQFHNPSALYLAAKRISRDVADARARVAGHFGARPAEVYFTAGGTEANNLAIQGVMQQFPGANVVVSAIEHESVLKPAHLHDCREVAVQADGRLDMNSLGQQIDEQTVLVSIMYANNEIGTIQPLKQVAQLLQEVRNRRKNSGNTLPLYFHTDACQATPYLDLHVARLGVDMMTINGGKMYGPKQSGALYVSSSVALQPQVVGGGQERGMRSGTENVPGIVGLAAALDEVQARRAEESARLKALQQLFIEAVAAKLPHVQIRGSLKYRLPNNVHLTIPGADNERLIMALDEAGIQAAAGSACSASSEEPSHVLKAIGMSETEAQSSLRFTMGRQTTEVQQVHTVIDSLARLLV